MTISDVDEHFQFTEGISMLAIGIKFKTASVETPKLQHNVSTLFYLVMERAQETASLTAN